MISVIKFVFLWVKNWFCTVYFCFYCLTVSFEKKMYVIIEFGPCPNILWSFLKQCLSVTVSLEKSAKLRFVAATGYGPSLDNWVLLKHTFFTFAIIKKYRVIWYNETIFYAIVLVQVVLKTHIHSQKEVAYYKWYNGIPLSLLNPNL